MESLSFSQPPHRRETTNAPLPHTKKDSTATATSKVQERDQFEALVAFLGTFPTVGEIDVDTLHDGVQILDCLCEMYVSSYSLLCFVLFHRDSGGCIFWLMYSSIPSLSSEPPTTFNPISCIAKNWTIGFYVWQICGNSHVVYKFSLPMNSTGPYSYYHHPTRRKPALPNNRAIVSIPITKPLSYHCSNASRLRPFTTIPPAANTPRNMPSFNASYRNSR